MEQLKHECGIAMIRLLKPLEYYQEKYGTWMFGLNKLYLLMEKQHNRGQEGAGLACVKMEANPGEEYMFRERALGTGAITEIFSSVQSRFRDLSAEQLANATYAKRQLPFVGEIYMGHLRYSTTGKSGLSFVHPFLRRNNWRAKNLALCGNFNLTNVDEVFADITAKGQHPRIYSDTYIMLEQVGHRLDRESERLYAEAVGLGLSGMDITHYIEERIDVNNVLRTAAPLWDGGYVVCGATGSGEMFVLRDPWGIRPAFWYKDDEVLVVASERPVIQTVFALETEQIHELMPGQAVSVHKDGEMRLEQILQPKEVKACSFERIYFSRGSDRDIYRERKRLGALLVPQILRSIDHDIENTVFSYIPNTAESAFFGLVGGLDEYCQHIRAERILHENGSLTEQRLKEILRFKPRFEKVAIKDVKMRTFITQDNDRDDLVAHVYDITYGTIRAGKDNLVILDDSIVRGTTLRQSIVRILDRLEPRKIVVCSSAPQIRYPDCYGIDMSRLGDFVAFRAAVELLRESGRQTLIDDVYRECLEQLQGERSQAANCVKRIYEPFTDEQISAKIAQIIKAPDIRSQVEVIGDYPTPGGNAVADQAFVNFYEKRNERAY